MSVYNSVQPSLRRVSILTTNRHTACVIFIHRIMQLDTVKVPLLSHTYSTNNEYLCNNVCFEADAHFDARMTFESQRRIRIQFLRSVSRCTVQCPHGTHSHAYYITSNSVIPDWDLSLLLRCADMSFVTPLFEHAFSQSWPQAFVHSAPLVR